MTILVRIPTPLRKITQGQDKAEIEAASIGELIDNLDQNEEQFPSAYVVAGIHSRCHQAQRDQC